MLWFRAKVVLVKALLGFHHDQKKLVNFGSKEDAILTRVHGEPNVDVNILMKNMCRMDYEDVNVSLTYHAIREPYRHICLFICVGLA